MKYQKDRVIAIDYFRGLCILVILLSHSSAFSSPFSYLSGMGALWSSAAEMFFLLSGITLGVVRGGAIKSNFWAAARKSWRRAGNIYLIHILAVLASISLALFLVSNNLPNDVAGTLPGTSGFSLLARIASLSYSVGWASFLMYYAIFMLIAPFALYTLRTRFWSAVPLLSAALYVANTPYPFHIISTGVYSLFGIWQFYFFLGMTIARFRVPIISWFYGLPDKAASRLATTLVSISCAVFALSVALGFNFYAIINSLTNGGWLPFKIRSAYMHLLDHKPEVDLWLMNSRSGILRPLAAIIFLAGAYLVYQRYKQPILARTGRFVSAMGRDTLWIFVAQAFAIPLLATIPLRHDSLINNFLLTSALLLLMWSITQRRAMAASFKLYVSELKVSYNEAKNAYAYRSENNS